MLVRFPLTPCAWLLAILLAGCNLFGVSDPGNSNTVDTLLRDARAALDTGDTERAVSILERAYARDSTHAVVRIELAGARLESENVDLWTLNEAVSRIARDEPTDPDDTTAPSSSPLACSSSASVTELTRVRYQEDADMQRIIDAGSTIREAHTLLPTEIPADQTEDIRSRLLLIRSVVQGVHAISQLHLASQTADALWYRTDEGALSFCADDEMALPPVVTEACRTADAFATSADQLALRGATGFAAQIVDNLGSAQSALRAEHNCS